MTPLHNSGRTAVAPLLLVLCALMAQSLVYAAPPPGSILIRNVRLIDVHAKGEDAVVSILIKDKVLDLVTREEVPATEAALVLDAENGFLIGRLDLGESASFLILETDPRQNLDVLFDTNRYAVFAIDGGTIRRNALPIATEKDEKPKAGGWLGYTPPPLALPLSYRDVTKWNRWKTRAFSGIFLGVIALDRQTWLSQDDAGKQQVGDLDEFTGGEIRGLRFGAVGTLNFKKPWTYVFFLASNAFDKGFDVKTTDGFQIYDLRFDIPLADRMILSVGKQKEPISMERLMNLVYLPTLERSAVIDALLPARNVGVTLHGFAANQRLTWASGVFNTGLEHAGSVTEGTTQVTARVTGLPFLTQDESNLLHLGFGARYSSANQPVRAFTEPEFFIAPDYVDTGPVEADGVLTGVFEASWRKGPYWLAMEYLTTYVDLPSGQDSRLGGYHVTGSWVATGEMRPYRKKGGIFDRLPVARSVYQRGRGALELGARWSSVDLSDGAVDGGEMNVLSLGANWWLTPFSSLNVDFRKVALDRFGVEGKSSGMTVRLVLSLE